MFDFKDIMTWETVKPYLRDRLLSKALAERIHGMVCQFIAEDIFRTWYVDIDPTHLAPVTVDLLNAWCVTPADLVAVAEQNSAGRVIQMCDMLGYGSDAVPMFIVTTQGGKWGASAIMHKDVQAQLARIFPGGYLVLPSSVHEVICVPAGSIDTADAAKMVKDINDAVVSDSDRLSDSVFVIRDGFLTAA